MICLNSSRAFFFASVISVFGTCGGLQAQTHGQTDTVSGPALSVAISTPDYDPAKIQTDECILRGGKPLVWAAGSPLFDLGTKAYEMQAASQSGPPTCTTGSYAADKDRAVILHLVHWSVPTSKKVLPQLQSSVWYVYRHPRNSKVGILVPASTTGTGDPLIYGAKHVLILNIDLPTAAIDPAALQSTITAPITQGTPDIATDISALFTALTGIAGGAVALAAQTNPAVLTAFVAVTCEDGAPKLPFSVQVADAAAQPSAPGGGGAPGGPAPMAATTPPPAGAGQKPGVTPAGTTSTTASGSVSCTGAGNTLPCTMGRTFTSKEHAYVDFSAGIAVPGVRDTSYTFSASSTSPGVSSPATRHTDAYALIDIFPLGAILPKESPVPHVNFGIPVTSQSLHRPYVGLAENLTGWTHLQKNLSLPIAINVFGGVVFVKTQQLNGTPTTQAAFNSDLSWHWVHKYLIGIEVPISSVTSKFTKSGGGGSSKTSTSKGS